MIASPDFLPALPEMFLGGCAMALLLIGVYSGDRAARAVSWLAVAALAATLALVLYVPYTAGLTRQVSLFGMFVTDGLGYFAKTLVILGSVLSLIISMRFNAREGLARCEFPVLVLIAIMGAVVLAASPGSLGRKE